MISVEALSCLHKKQIALNKLSFQVEKGAFCLLLGDNGSGKSTLLKTLAGIKQPAYCSKLAFQTEKVAYRTSITYLPEKCHYPKNIKVTEYLSFISKLYCDNSIVDRSISLLKTLGFTNSDLSKKIKQLSRGNEQKIGCAAVLCSKSAIMLLDEPLESLDATSRVSCIAKMKEVTDAGTTLLVSTHAVGEIASVSNKVLLLKKGKLAFSGATIAFFSENPHYLYKIKNT